MALNKKILISATVYSHIAAFHKSEILMLVDKGYEVHIAANPGHGRKEEIEELGVICWDIPFSRSPYSSDNLKAYRMLIELFRNHDFELIHVHTPVASFLVRYAAKKSNQGKVLYTAHGFHFYKGAPLLNWIVYYIAEKIAGKWTDALLLMNQEDMKYGEQIGFIRGKNLYFLHGVGINLNRYAAVFDENQVKQFRETLGIKPDDVVISCIAEFIPRKNHLFLLEVWKRLQQKHDNIHLWLVGKGKDETKLKNFIQQHSLRHIHFLGFRKDIPELLNCSDIVALMSKHEGLPRCIMEAMACAKPSIVSNVRGSRDLIQDGYNGFTIDLPSYEQATEKFSRLIENETIRKQFGNRNLEVIQKYAIDDVLNSLWEIYSRYLPDGGNAIEANR